MRTLIDARLVEEARRLAFRFACEDCAHFGAEQERCSFGYHAAPRCAELDLDAPRDPAEAAAGGSPSLELCKAFELA